jgi:hypothetical protein
VAHHGTEADSQFAPICREPGLVRLVQRWVAMLSFLWCARARALVVAVACSAALGCSSSSGSPGEKSTAMETTCDPARVLSACSPTYAGATAAFCNITNAIGGFWSECTTLNVVETTVGAGGTFCYYDHASGNLVGVAFADDIPGGCTGAGQTDDPTCQQAVQHVLTHDGCGDAATPDAAH